MNLRPLALLAVALALAAPALGQTSPPTPPATPAPPAVADADRGFARRAVGAGLAEVEAGKLAMDRATSEQVKTFARSMVVDHSAANEALAAIAKRKGIALPKSPDKAHQSQRQKLAGLKGAEFERAYVDGQLIDHRKAVALFERQAKNGRDPELRKFAVDTLPKLKGHLSMAENLAKPATTSAAPQAGGRAAHLLSGGGDEAARARTAALDRPQHGKARADAL